MVCKRRERSGETSEKSVQKTCRNDCRNNRNEYIAQCLKYPLPDGSLGSGCLLNIVLTHRSYAGKIYELYDIRPQDTFIIISNSGINGIVIDIADLAKRNGHKVVIITSMKHTLAEEPRHPSGKKLYEFGDIVIDNCGPHGDTLIETDGVAKVCSVSSICNNCIAQALSARTVELLKEDGYELPILTGEKEHDEALIKKYEGRA